MEIFGPRMNGLSMDFIRLVAGKKREEFLPGIEVSIFVLTDGESYLIFPEAKDYKRIGEGDTGLNTGGSNVWV